MLISAVLLYLAVTVAIGLYASRKVNNSTDFLVAGRSLPLYMNIATVFATWFGAETVLAVSSTFLQDGLGGVVADPFGASFCLFFVAIFFARRFYRLNLLTIGDFYRKRFNKTVEIGASMAIAISYLGWSSAQMVALGIVFNVLSKGAITIEQGIMLGGAVVLVYTLFGGMWSVAFTDIFQVVIIMLGLLYIAMLVSGFAGGADKVLAAATSEGKTAFWPALDTKEIIAFVAAFATMALGSIAQQDVFQRVTSAKDEDTAVRGTLLGGMFYFAFAFVPMFIAVSAFLIDPEMVKTMLAGEDNEHQLVLPTLILNHTPVFAQILFFGALLSAILSTASGTILAPTAVFTENILKPITGGRMSEKQFLLTLRIVLVSVALGVMLFALNSESSMFEMVQNAYKVVLVTAFCPLAFGMFWKRATPQGATISMILGIITWIAFEFIDPEGLIPPQFMGFFAAIFGMIVGSLMPRLFGGAGHPHIVDLASTKPPAGQHAHADV
jgi:SSS family transporter